MTRGGLDAKEQIQRTSMTPLLEVIACSVADAVEAEKGGASRLEIVRDLGRGGLTPPLELVCGD